MAASYASLSKGISFRENNLLILKLIHIVNLKVSFGDISNFTDIFLLRVDGQASCPGEILWSDLFTS
jgi:hypothetical protein